MTPTADSQSAEIVTMTLRLPADLHRFIQVRSDKLDRSMSWYINNMLEVGMARQMREESAEPLDVEPLGRQWAIAAEAGMGGHTYELGCTFALPPVDEPDFIAYDIRDHIIRVIGEHGAKDPVTRLISLAGMRMDTRPGQGYAHNNPDDLLLPEA